jgi:CheY-like chemotaxis protein
LLVEDDSVDAIMVKRALEILKVTNPLVNYSDGEEALNYLRDPNNKKPGIILLDLNMPKMDGLEFLKVIKANDDFRKIPIIALTTSDDERDITESFKHGIAGYMVKALDNKTFVETIRIIDRYWTLSELPNGD